METIRRRIIKREWYTALHARRDGGLLLTLECGHEDGRKASAAPKGRIIRCRQCEDIRDGQVSMWPTEGIKDAWDAKTGMPIKVPMTKEDHKRCQ